MGFNCGIVGLPNVGKSTLFNALTKKIIKSLPIVALLLTAPTWANAANRCDELAAHPEDPQNPAGVVGVSFYNIDYEPALRACQNALEKEPDNARYQYLLGRVYDVAEDYATSLKWYRKASAGGYASAQKRIGDMYYHGEGVETSYEKAVEWYRKAAEKGHMIAQFNLGIFYENGMGVKQSYEDAAKWYEKAAKQGEGDAQYNLGNLYYYGIGVQQSYETAAQWYRKSAEQGDASAQYNLANVYYRGEGVPQSYETAVLWYRKATEQDHVSAQYNLGNAYYYGEGVALSRKMAEEWFLKAAEQGDSDAQYRLGNLYFSRSSENSYDTARKWYRQAAEQGNTDAYFAIGLTYEYEDDASQNKKLAYAWYDLGLKNGQKDTVHALRRIKKAMTPEEIAEAKKIDPLTTEQ